MVGPSSAELESLNELIKFDHIYYKAEPNAKGGVKSSISSQTDSSVQQTTVHSGQIEIKEEESQPSVTVTDENSNMQVDVPTISIDDTTSLEDVTSLQLLEDIESLLQSEDLLDVADMDPASLIPQSETPIQNKCSQSRGQKRKHSSSVTSSSSPNSLTVEDHIQDYFSDSGVSGDLSDVPSPASDISSCLGDDSWEESFTELFPDLL